jgi:hypothetical protein
MIRNNNWKENMKKIDCSRVYLKRLNFPSFNVLFIWFFVNLCEHFLDIYFNVFHFYFKIKNKSFLVEFDFLKVNNGWQKILILSQRQNKIWIFSIVYPDHSYVLLNFWAYPMHESVVYLFKKNKWNFYLNKKIFYRIIFFCVSSQLTYCLLCGS